MPTLKSKDQPGLRVDRATTVVSSCTVHNGGMNDASSTAIVALASAVSANARAIEAIAKEMGRPIGINIAASKED